MVIWPVKIDSHRQFDIESTVSRALLEDIGDRYLTTDLIPSNATFNTTVVVREDMTLTGRPWGEDVFLQIDYSLAQV